MVRGNSSVAGRNDLTASGPPHAPHRLHLSLRHAYRRANEPRSSRSAPARGTIRDRGETSRDCLVGCSARPSLLFRFPRPVERIRRNGVIGNEGERATGRVFPNPAAPDSKSLQATWQLLPKMPGRCRVCHVHSSSLLIQIRRSGKLYPVFATRDLTTLNPHIATQAFPSARTRS